MTIAILDLGTNTFNLLIAEKKDRQVRSVFEKKIPVKIGAGGITQKRITEEAFDRGIKAIQKLYGFTREYKCDKVIVTATSMLRDADNGNRFKESVKDLTGIEIEIISGEREAELIWKGVHSAVAASASSSGSFILSAGEKYLIMDIGGGSTEFIIADQASVHWKKSYQLGVTRLYERLLHSDPVTTDELNKVNALLSAELKELFDLMNKYRITKLIGAAGSFESFLSMISFKENNSDYNPSVVLAQIPLPSFIRLTDELIAGSHAERKKIKGLIELRRDLIVLSSILTRHVIDKGGIDSLYLSTYSLKEGILTEELQNS